jgi:hypothetical protein
VLVLVVVMFNARKTSPFTFLYTLHAGPYKEV